ncbi:MFS transporter [Streptomyces sp. NPDC033538]|uniref:MFS transporter n=1 Tax=Streptomyces sp. NPDC033538 TaxID=3155367 RepID=UPI0033CDF69C
MSGPGKVAEGSAKTNARGGTRTWPGVRWSILSANAVVLVVNYGDRAAIGVAAPLIVKEFGFSPSTMGLVMSAFAFTYAPASFFGGALADRFGPRKVMTAAVVWWSVFTAAAALCWNATSFLVQRLLFGLGEGPQGSVTARTMSNWFPRREYATAVGLTFAANPLGAAIGTPVVAGLLVWSGNNWRVPFAVLGAVGVLVAVLWYFFVRDRPEEHPRVSARELDHIVGGELARPDDGATEAPSVGYYLRKPAVLATALAFFGFNWITFLFLSWYPTYLVQERGVELSSLAWAGSLPWIAGAVGTAVGGILSDRLAKRFHAPYTVRKWAAVLGLALGGLLCFGITSISGTVLSVALFTLTMLLLYTSNAQFWALVQQCVHPGRVGAVSGFVHFCANLAAIIAPAVTGFLVDDLDSWGAAFSLAAVLAVLGAAVLALAPRPAPVTASGSQSSASAPATSGRD